MLESLQTGWRTHEKIIHDYHGVIPFCFGFYLYTSAYNYKYQINHWLNTEERLIYEKLNVGVTFENGQGF